MIDIKLFDVIIESLNYSKDKINNYQYLDLNMKNEKLLLINNALEYIREIKAEAINAIS